MLYTVNWNRFLFTVFHNEIRQIALSLAGLSSFGKQSRDSDEQKQKKLQQQQKNTNHKHIHYTFISKKAKMNY